jgi:hypothetical protein
MNNRHSFIIAKITVTSLDVISLLVLPRFPSDAAVLTRDQKLLSRSSKNVNKNQGVRGGRGGGTDGSAFASVAEQTLRTENSILLDVSRVDSKKGNCI